MKKSKYIWGILSLVVTLSIGACEALPDDFTKIIENTVIQKATTQSYDHLPTEYDGGYTEIVINDNRPTFTDSDLDLSNGVWQTFSDLDHLNRVGVADALIGKESFPEEERASRMYVKPTGWNQQKTGSGANDWLYNRCHLIGHQMTGENDNPKNLMTGTRKFNDPHMKNYETQLMDYIRLTGNHVRYRVTPHFIGNELVARGVQMEAEGIEDQQFAYNVYVYNVQEGYTIDYETGRATKN